MVHRSISANPWLLGPSTNTKQSPCSPAEHGGCLVFVVGVSSLMVEGAYVWFVEGGCSGRFQGSVVPGRGWVSVGHVEPEMPGAWQRCFLVGRWVPGKPRGSMLSRLQHTQYVCRRGVHGRGALTVDRSRNRSMQRACSPCSLSFCVAAGGRCIYR